MISIPEEYVVQTFYQCVSHATYNKLAKTYNGSCPFCKEGKSFGKKTRFYYIPKKELTFCHNCGYSKKVFNFILDVTGKPFNVIVGELRSYETQPAIIEEKQQKIQTKSLPQDCINLLDENQLQYWKDNKITQIALQFIKDRYLNIAINKPKTFYLSLTDRVHKNRLIIPFYNELGDIIFYQSRTLLENDNKYKPKYLSKIGAEKTLAGIENIDSKIDQLFLFEGPIDSYFIKNGLAVGGIQDESKQLFTETQQKQVNQYGTYNKIWCLDNQWCDIAALKKSFILANQGENVFIWPEEQKKYKDLNDLCIAEQKQCVELDFIVKNTFKSLKATIILTKIKNSM